MSLFEKMHQIAMKARKGVIEGYDKHDLAVDQDVIENTAVTGDEYLWLIKTNECGTNLPLLNGVMDNDLAEYVLTGETTDPKHVYHVKITDMEGNGEIKHITVEKAKEVIRNSRPRPNRVPKKEHFGLMLNRLVPGIANIEYAKAFSDIGEKPPKEMFVQVGPFMNHMGSRSVAIFDKNPEGKKKVEPIAQFQSHSPLVKAKEGVFQVNMHDWPNCMLDMYAYKPDPEPQQRRIRTEHESMSPSM